MSKNKELYPRVYTLHSQKGGVGKTSIAIAIASLEAIYHKKKTVIIDADMTGSSLEDVFSINSEEHTYLNDLILASPVDFEKYTSLLLEKQSFSQDQTAAPERLSSFRQIINQDLYYMPGSPILKEIKRVVPLISQEDYLHFFRRRLEDIIVATFAEKFDVIVVDHSPGLFGLSYASLDMMLDQQVKGRNKGQTRLSRLMQAMGETRELPVVKSVLVTTPERVDHISLLSSFSHILEGKFPDDKSGIIGETISLLNNKAKAGDGEIFDPVFAMTKIFDSQKQISTKRRMKQWIIDALLEKTKATGAIPCQYIDGFDIEEIVSTVSALKHAEKKSSRGMGAWCQQIGNSLGILEPRSIVRS